MARLFSLVFLLGMLVLAGCGGGNNGSAGLNGSLTVAAAQAVSDTSSNVTFTITYTNPYTDDLLGVPINFIVSVDGALIDNVATNFSNSGVLQYTYGIPKTTDNQTVYCQANTGNLISSNAVTVAALNALEIQPTSATFAADDAVGSTLTFTIAGGITPYDIVVTQTVAGLVTSSVSGSTLTLTRNSTNGGTVTITVTDNNGSGTSVTATVTVTAIP